MRTNSCLALILSIFLQGQVLAGDDTNDLKAANDEFIHSENLDTAIRLGTGGHPVDRSIAAIKEKFNEIADPKLEKARAKIRSIGERLGIESDSLASQDEDRTYRSTAGDESSQSRAKSYKSRLENLGGTTNNADYDGPTKQLLPEAKRACDKIIPDQKGRSDCYAAYRAAMPRTNIADLIKDERYPRNLAEGEDICNAPSRRDWTLQPVADACIQEMVRKFSATTEPGNDRLQSMLNGTGSGKTGGGGLEGIMQQQQQQENAVAEAARQARLAQQQREAAARQAAAARAQAVQQQRAAQEAAQQAQERETDDGLALFGQVVGAALNATARRATVPTYTAPPSRPTAYGSQSGGNNGVGSQGSGSVAPPAAGGTTSRSPCYPNAC
jgi:hypothetical protein